MKASINTGGITIAAYMKQRQIMGGIELEPTVTLDLKQDDGSKTVTANQECRYEVGTPIAKGGMGAILTVMDTNIRRNIAMKVLLDPKGAGHDGILRFIEEAQITGQLEHPGIVPLHELGVDAAGNVFYTMKLLKGKTLHQILKEVRSGNEETIKEFPLNNLLVIFQKICHALAFAHSKRVIHRDLKPENIMVGDFGEVQVMDWGLAKIFPRHKIKQSHRNEKDPQNAEIAQNAIDSVRKDAAFDTLKTVIGAIMGTPGFMAPEQALGRTAELDERTDVYALGSILYHILTLHIPVEGKDMLEAVTKITTGAIPYPTEYNPRKTIFGKVVRTPVKSSVNTIIKYIRLRHLPNEIIPEPLAAVSMKAMDLDPWKRYQTVQKLQNDVEAYQNGFTTSAEHAGLWRHIGLFIKRHKTVTALVAILLVLTFTGITISATEWIKAEKARKVAETERGHANDALLALKSSASDLALLSQRYVAVQKPGKALEKITFAAELEPNNSEYLYRKGNALQIMLRLKDAVKAYEQALSLNSKHKMARENLDLCKRIIKKSGNKNSLELSAIYALYLGIRGQGRIDEAVATIASSTPSGEPLEAFMRRMLNESGIRYKHVVIDKNGYCGLDLSDTAFSDLPRLHDIPVRWLDMTNSLVSDLTPIKGMPLNHLNLYATRIENISALKGMPLNTLNLDKTDVYDLSPLAAMPLISLSVNASKLSDITPIKNLPLANLSINQTKVRDLSPLKNMNLNRLDISFTEVTDLSPLKGMPLTSLNINNCPVTDLTPLRNLPLTELNMRDSPATDFSPLKNLTLVAINIAGTKFTNLSSLKDMPLSRISLDEQTSSNLFLLAETKTLTRVLNRIGDADLSLTLCLFDTVKDALANKKYDLARKAAAKILADWEDVPAMSNICYLAKQTVNAAIPVMQTPYNIPNGVEYFKGHHYVLFSLPMSWEDARKHCTALGGHLVTITSREEQEWILKIYHASNQIWIGGYRDKLTGEWKWVSNEPWEYTNWLQDVPLNVTGTDEVLEIKTKYFNPCSGRQQKICIVEWDH